MKPCENYYKGERKGRLLTACPSLLFFIKGGEFVSCNFIRGGFSFCGVDIAELGLSYAPELENTYVFHQAEVNVHEETFDGHHGGYFYGVSKQPKEFTLRCYFEGTSIDRGLMERINHLFRVGKSGKLIFCRRPWCYYYATVTSLPHPELNNYLNGMITVTMKAYYPYARGDEMYYNIQNTSANQYFQKEYHDLVMESTAVLEASNMVPTMSFSNVRAARTFLLHNPGTEYAPLSITASGNVGLGVIIRNNTTKQECKIVAMDKAHTSNIQRYVYIDGINGCTSLIGGVNPEPAFLYHDSGFIYLAPAYPAHREIFVLEAAAGVITLVNTLTDNVEGQYIFLNNAWCKITEQIDEQHIRIDTEIDMDSTDRTIITQMNEMEIIPLSTIDLTHLSFSYKPTYA